MSRQHHNRQMHIVYQFKYDYVLESPIKSLNVYQHLRVEMFNSIIIIIVPSQHDIRVYSLVVIVINTIQSKADNRTQSDN